MMRRMMMKRRRRRSLPLQRCLGKRSAVMSLASCAAPPLIRGFYAADGFCCAAVLCSVCPSLPVAVPVHAQHRLVRVLFSSEDKGNIEACYEGHAPAGAVVL
jgi:hypothetical protein